MPTMCRTLKNEGSTVSHGTLRGFFEVMTDDYAQQHPPFTLASAEPDDYQLRVRHSSPVHAGSQEMYDFL